MLLTHYYYYSVGSNKLPCTYKVTWIENLISLPNSQSVKYKLKTKLPDSIRHLNVFFPQM